MAILKFLQAFKMVCDTNRIHEGAVIWLFYFSMKKTASAALRAITCPTSWRRSRKEGKYTSYWEVVNFLLNTYATDDTTAEAYAYIIKNKQPQDLNTVDYLQFWGQMP